MTDFTGALDDIATFSVDYLYDSVEVTCELCGASEESYGTGDDSIWRSWHELQDRCMNPNAIHTKAGLF